MIIYSLGISMKVEEPIHVHDRFRRALAHQVHIKCQLAELAAELCLDVAVHRLGDVVDKCFDVWELHVALKTAVNIGC